jgi:hypothetical protein
MKRFSWPFAVLSLVFSLGAYQAANAAESPDVSLFGIPEGIRFDHTQLHQCLKQAWKQATPTDIQRGEAKTLVQGARDVLTAHREALQKAKQDLLTAWSKFPIVHQEVMDAENALKNEMMVVHSAFRDAKINALNLLTQDQKNTFNQSFQSCCKQQKERERRGEDSATEALE